MTKTMINAIDSDFKNRLDSCNNLSSLQNLRVFFLGKNGIITAQMQNISKISSIEEKRTLGRNINELKNRILTDIAFKQDILEKQELENQLKLEKLDISLPARDFVLGKQHVMQKVIEDIIDIFAYLGFDCIDGPEIETDWYNFTALNIPLNHSARQSHDTFYFQDFSQNNNNNNIHIENSSKLDNANRLKNSELKNSLKNDNLMNKNTRQQDNATSEYSKILLRTQTSNVQIRHMKTKKPPHYIITIGKVYRADYDMTHSPMFHQLECLCIDKNISMAQMKWSIQRFLQMFFQINDLPLRFRSSYFPFTEPSAEVDIQCDRSSDKEQIKMGVGNDWLEILGCGMVHPNVLKNAGVSDEYRGFAFGMGIERLAMLKYNISDLRNFFENDLRWLRFYGQ